ncbi:MFS transporter [Pseudomonas syringae]|uniref:MFS transporter n=1 Tax=Pseudomonas syringae TaxID=317 RepID=UPI0002D3DED0|nr:MFS transporter [Pseudomonas syringae]KOG03509.1 Drug resistance transporter, EmrB/QacA subfamily protein [Pseudomonas syringae pv. aceris]
MNRSNAPTNTELQGFAPLDFSQALLAMIGIALVSMLIALDQTVVSTALPSIVEDLKGFEYYTWVANGYLLASIAVVPVFGRLGDLFGRKPFVVASVVIFTIGSILCGLADSMPMLVAARALQGLGGGMMVGNAFASVADMFPDAHARVRWQVVIAAAYGIGTASGPSLGGLLTEQYGWRSTFLINLPVGLASLYCLWRYLPAIRHPQGTSRAKVRIDIAGALLITWVLASLQLFVERVPETGLAGSTWLLLAAVIVGTVLFLICEHRASHPIIPLDLFRERDLVMLLGLSVLMGFIMFSLLFFTPLLLQGGFGLAPHEAGLLATPLAVCIAIGSMLNTRIVVRLRRPVKILTTGFTFMLVASLALAGTQIRTPHLILVAALMLAGVGLGFSINNLNVFSQNIVGRERFGIITALLQSTRMVGGMLGTTLIGTVVSLRYASNIDAKVQLLFPSGTPAALAERLRDPQVLLDTQGQAQIVDALRGMPIRPETLLAAAREVLVDAVHSGMLATALAAVAAIVLTWRLLHLRLAPAKAQS